MPAQFKHEFPGGAVSLNVDAGVPARVASSRSNNRRGIATVHLDGRLVPPEGNP